MVRIQACSQDSVIILEKSFLPFIVPSQNKVYIFLRICDMGENRVVSNSLKQSGMHGIYLFCNLSL